MLLASAADHRSGGWRRKSHVVLIMATTGSILKTWRNSSRCLRRAPLGGESSAGRPFVPSRKTRSRNEKSAGTLDCSDPRAPGWLPGVIARRDHHRGAKCGQDKPFDLVFHGGSGSAESEIREAIAYGVVKMNGDTDTQYWFTRPVAGHMFSNYDGVVKVDGEVGSQKAYDPAQLGQIGRGGHGRRVTRAFAD
jgi:hypothetical protein